MLTVIKMSKKDLKQIIEFPEGVNVDISMQKIDISGKNGKISRNLAYQGVEFEKKNNQIIIFAKSATKKEKRAFNFVFN